MNMQVDSLKTTMSCPFSRATSALISDSLNVSRWNPTPWFIGIYRILPVIFDCRELRIYSLLVSYEFSILWLPFFGGIGWIFSGLWEWKKDSLGRVCPLVLNRGRLSNLYRGLQDSAGVRGMVRGRVLMKKSLRYYLIIWKEWLSLQCSHTS